MVIQSFNNELMVANLMFQRIFKNIEIIRSINGKDKSIPVNCVFGQRSRILKNLQNPERMGTIKLPLLVINRTGWSRNSERLNNINNEVKYEVTSKTRDVNLLTPIPIDISYDVSIMSKYPSDIDQIASNFSVFFNNDIYVSSVHPKYEGLRLNNQIVMSDSVSEEHPDELDATNDDFQTTTFQFTFKTCLFGGAQKAKKLLPQVLSSVLSTYVETKVHVVPQNQLSTWLDKHLNVDPLSIMVDTTITRTTKVLVDNPDAKDISDDYYVGFTPIINSLNLGFYPTPTSADFRQYFSYVDSLDDSVQPLYVDRLNWVIDNQISVPTYGLSSDTTYDLDSDISVT